MKQQWDRRRFVFLSGLGIVGWMNDWLPGGFGAEGPREWDPFRPSPRLGEKLKVQLLLMYSLPSRREQASWKSWGGVQTESAVTEEVHVKANPSYEICRSPQDVEISGDWRRLIRELRDSHLVMCYGDFVREAG